MVLGVCSRTPQQPTAVIRNLTSRAGIQATGGDCTLTRLLITANPRAGLMGWVVLHLSFSKQNDSASCGGLVWLRGNIAATPANLAKKTGTHSCFRQSWAAVCLCAAHQHGSLMSVVIAAARSSCCHASQGHLTSSPGSVDASYLWQPLAFTTPCLSNPVLHSITSQACTHLVTWLPRRYQHRSFSLQHAMSRYHSARLRALC